MRNNKDSYGKLVLVFLLGFVFVTANVQSQNTTFSVRGIVKDAKNKQPIELALVSIVDLGLWARTDDKGNFELKNIPSGKYSVKFYILGYEEKIVSKSVTSNIEGWEQFLQASSFALDEITVTAKENKLGSITQIGANAIEHIQPKSLSDVFQLLPGQITQNPSLAKPTQVTLRSITDASSDKGVDNSALGTLIVMDGAPVTNDANMLSYTGKAGGVLKGASTVGKGVDLRDISAENLESIEVIKGVASSEYGNMTSGVVIVKTKIGEQPWTAKVKMDPNTKMGSLYKGFKLSNNGGILNAGIDYAQAYDDIREKYKGYTRITGTAAYANSFLKESTPLDFNVRISGFTSLDDEKADVQLSKNDRLKSSQKGLRLAIDGKLMLQKSWITSLDYSVSGDYALSEIYERKAQSLASGAVPNPISYEDGVYAVDFLPGVFESESTIESSPYNIFAKLKANWNRQFVQTSVFVKTGVDFSTNGNTGDGLKYDMSRPPSTSLGNSLRPRGYSDIPTMQNYAAFIEAKIGQPIASTLLTVQAGGRFAYVNPGDYAAIEPRINVEYEFLNKQNNSIFDRMGITVGYGESAKMPPLSYISPNHIYFDDLSFNYLDGANSLAVVTTNVLDVTNKNLKPARSNKKEVGFYFDIKKVSFSLTGYYEKLSNGFSYTTIPYISTFNRYTVTGAGKKPEFEDGQVYYYDNGVRLPASYTTEKRLNTYGAPSNNSEIIKRGVEYSINIARIKEISSSFVIDGAWMSQESYTTDLAYMGVNTTYQGKEYPYIAITPPGKQKKVRSRFNTNIRMITQVPKLGLVISFTPQVVWTNKWKNRWDDSEGNSLVYYRDASGNKVYGDDALVDRKETRYIDPIAFMDKDGVVHEWKEEYATQAPYSSMVSAYGQSYSFVEESFSPTVQFNLRLTKEFSRQFALSFTANNFLMSKDKQWSKRTSQYESGANTSFYFGAELNYKF